MVHIEQVEIYSDQTNRAVMRHPGRRFPGVLMQGDTLHALCMKADHLCGQAHPSQTAELNELRNALWSFLAHYKAVLGEHGIPLPFSEDQTLS